MLSSSSQKLDKTILKRNKAPRENHEEILRCSFAMKLKRKGHKSVRSGSVRNSMNNLKYTKPTKILELNVAALPFLKICQNFHVCMKSWFLVLERYGSRPRRVCLEDRRDACYNDCGHDDNVKEENGNEMSHGIKMVMTHLCPSSKGETRWSFCNNNNIVLNPTI